MALMCVTARSVLPTEREPRLRPGAAGSAGLACTVGACMSVGVCFG